VVDGDTIHMRLDGRDVTVALHGIDVPEFDQEYGSEAADALRKFVDSRQIADSAFKRASAAVLLAMRTCS
jgi:endonuclease YncB( thermonuclease family)